MTSAQRVPHHILPRRRSNNLRAVGEAADDGHAGEAGGGGGGEGAGGGGSGEREEGGEARGEERHCGGAFVGCYLVLVLWVGGSWLRGDALRWLLISLEVATQRGLVVEVLTREVHEDP